MKYFSILILSLIILVSGCVNPPTTSGVVIKQWTPAVSEVYSEQPIILRLVLENVGSIDAKEVSAKVENLDTSTPQVCTFSKLEKNEPKFCNFGEDNQLKAPKVTKGFTQTYKPTIVVKYKYSTESVLSFPISDINELMIRKENGQSFPVQTKSSTQSPISAKIVTADVPISFGELSFPLTVEVNNDGKGTACHPNCEEEDKQKIQDDKQKIHYQLTKLGDVNIKNCQPSGDIYLLFSNIIRCDIKVNTDSLSGASVKVVLEYEYMIEQETTLKVSGST